MADAVIADTVMTDADKTNAVKADTVMADADKTDAVNADTVMADAVMRVFDRLYCIQFDPLSVAGRNHDIALQARVQNYVPAVCERLLYTDRRLLDGWDKKMSVIRAADWPMFRPFHDESRERLSGADGPVFMIIDKVRAYIREHGPATAKMLDMPGEAIWWFGTGNWGSSNPGRVALEAMVTWGELIVANKDNNRKSYDFAAKLLPGEIVGCPNPHASGESYAEWLVLRRTASAGLIRKGQSPAWSQTAVLSPEARNSAITRCLNDGRLIIINIEGSKAAFLARREDWERYVAEGFAADERLRFIAPLDNLMWDKSLIRTLFGFDYQWEVYTPPQSRKYGYYVLPILAGDTFVGRIEPVFHKGGDKMIVRGLWWEPGVKPRNYSGKPLRRALESYARFLGANDYEILPV
jgi:uncharacterized protein YcaQ